MVREKGLLIENQQRQMVGFSSLMVSPFLRKLIMKNEKETMRDKIVAERQRACEEEREFARQRYQKQLERDEMEVCFPSCRLSIIYGKKLFTNNKKTLVPTTKTQTPLRLLRPTTRPNRTIPPRPHNRRRNPPQNPRRSPSNTRIRTRQKRRPG